VAGGALGLLLASGCMELLVSFIGRFTTRAAEIRISTEVLLFTLGVSILTGLIFGSIPAFSQQLNLVTSLKEGSANATVKASGLRLRNVLGRTSGTELCAADCRRAHDAQLCEAAAGQCRLQPGERAYGEHPA